MSSKAGETLIYNEEESIKEEIQEVDFREWKNEIHVEKKGEKGSKLIWLRTQWAGKMLWKWLQLYAMTVHRHKNTA